MRSGKRIKLSWHVRSQRILPNHSLVFQPTSRNKLVDFWTEVLVVFSAMSRPSGIRRKASISHRIVYPARAIGGMRIRNDSQYPINPI